MSEPLLITERDGGIVTVTVNRPDAMNALSRALRSEFVGTFAALREDTAVGVVILTGAGKAFCAVLDLKEVGSQDAGDAERESAVAGARRWSMRTRAWTAPSSVRSTALRSPAASSSRWPATF
ncbi:MAG TPA: enoyl-CoA hydratase-related protein [Candidatus Binatia bacterium]|nr:enoyl-CoA hydratase-related protein [Candidatus Binatia bacterium]